MKLLKWFGLGVVCLCVGTVLAQAIGLTALALRGQLRRERVQRALAALYGIEPPPPAAAASGPATPEELQASLDEVLAARVSEGLDMDLRESALDKALGDLRALEASLLSQRERYDALKTGFEKRLAELEGATTEDSLLEALQTLEAMQPRQAKEQLLLMLQEDEGSGDGKALTDVVTLIKAMRDDKRRKVLAEFRSEDEIEKLHEILRQIRLGEPEVSLIRETRRLLKDV